MAFVERDGAEIYFETAGEGPPLVLIAGIASDVASWAPVVPLLSRSFRLVMLDNRGAGRTTCQGSINSEDWIADTIAVMDQLNIARADILGHSLGGMIALRLALSAPNRIGRLVIASSSVSPDAKSQALLREMADLYQSELPAEAWFRLLFQWLFAPGFFENEAAVREAGVLAAGYEHCQSPRDFKRQVDALKTLQDIPVEQITASCLALRGAHDILVPDAAGSAHFRQLPDVRFENIASAGHSLHWDKPAEFARTVETFLTKAEK